MKSRVGKRSQEVQTDGTHPIELNAYPRAEMGGNLHHLQQKLSEWVPGPLRCIEVEVNTGRRKPRRNAAI